MKFVETIQILNGVPQRVASHNVRCNDTRNKYFDVDDLIDLSTVITVPQNMYSGLVKCRVIYAVQIQEVSYQHYESRVISSLKIVHCNDIEYSDKATPRLALDNLYALRESHDEIIIIKNGLVTDAYYYNLAFRKGDQWFTPKTPLLKGIMRQSLLKQGILLEKDILEKDILDYDQIALFNALNEFGAVLLDVEEVYF